MTGQTISHYRILAKLGEGAMGVVYRAEDTKLRRNVALKFLPNAEGDAVLRDRFLREAQAAAALNHPNICTIFEIDEERGFLAMELVEGQSLKDKIAERPLKLDEALDFASQIAAGLQAAHDKGVTHRDTKPANILLTANGQVKITDFGLAALADRTRITKTGTSMGTPAYMSPEQAKGEPLDRRTDLWSLGVVLYEMLTGRLPFPGQTEQAVAYGVVHTDPEPPTALRSGLPVDIDRVTAKALAKNPRERYQNAADLQVDLRRVSHTAIPTQKAAPRRTNWLAAALGVALLGLAIAAWQLWRARDTWVNPLADATFTRLTDFEGSEYDAAISPDGKFVAFISDRDGVSDLWAGQIGSGEFINLTKGRYGNMDQNTRDVGFNGDGSHIFFAGSDGRKQMIPTMGGTAKPILTAVTYAWSPDGERSVYHLSRGDPIFIGDRNLNNGKKIFQGAEEEHCHFPVWSADSRHIYFSRGDPAIPQMDLWRIPVEGGEPERITNQNGDPRFTTVLDTRTLLYTGPGEDGSGPWLWAVDTEHRVPRRVTTGMENYTSIQASVDGRRLVATVANPITGLWSVPIGDRPADDSAATRVVLPSVRAQVPRYGPDYFTFFSSRGGGDGIWKFQNGMATELWKASDGAVTYPPAVSADGRQICFSYRKQGRTGLHVMTSDGTGVRPLAENLDVRGSAAWSPDGNFIAVGGVQGKTRGLFKVPLQGGAVTILANAPSPSSNPVWFPDNSLIVYSEAVVGRYNTLGAVRPDGTPYKLPSLALREENRVLAELFPTVFSQPGVRVRSYGERYRVTPDSKSLILMFGTTKSQQFHLFNVATGEVRQLTNFRPGYAMRTFDISPDGKTILFDRRKDNSDIVLIELKQK